MWPSSSGPLRSQVPLSQQLLQRLMEQLLRSGLQTCLSAVAGMLPQDAADRAVAAVKDWQQKKQRQWQLNGLAAAAPAPAEALLPWQASAVPAGAAVVSTLFSITGPPPEVPASLKHWATQGWPAARPGPQLGAAVTTASAVGEQSKGPTASMAAATAQAGAARPDDFCNLLAVAALGFCRKMANLGGFAQEQVLHAMPCLCLLLQKGRQHCTQHLLEAYEQLRQELPEHRRHGLRLRDVQIKPPVVPDKQPQKQQVFQKAPGTAPMQQAVQQQGMAITGPIPAASHASCAVPRRPAAAAGGALLYDHQQLQQAAILPASPADGTAKRRRVEVPQDSQVFSQQGGRAASCAVVTQMQARQQEQQQRQKLAEEQPQQHQHQVASAAQDSDGEECTSSRLSRRNPDPKPHQQGVQQPQPPDTRSQDQDLQHQQRQQYTADTKGRHPSNPLGHPQKQPSGSAVGSRELVGLVVNCKKINSAEIQAYKLELRVRDGSCVQLALSDGWATR
jgi:hypothetical protein